MPSVVDVMGFDGVHRASVGLQVPGAGILPLLLWERVNSGVATSMITRLEPFESLYVERLHFFF